MIHFEYLLCAGFFCIMAGTVLFCFSESLKRKKEKVETAVKIRENTEEDETIDPMTLRNGYGVTKDRNPTFAEQWVNIMNYSGESQLEGDYDEIERNNSTNYLGRVS